MSYFDLFVKFPQKMASAGPNARFDMNSHLPDSSDFGQNCR